MSWLPLTEWDQHKKRVAMIEALHFEVSTLRHILKDLRDAGGGFTPKARVLDDFIRAYDDCL
jgi:hypothetical protein